MAEHFPSKGRALGLIPSDKKKKKDRKKWKNILCSMIVRINITWVWSPTPVISSAQEEEVRKIMA
jgi:hypothetical protein